MEFKQDYVYKAPEQADVFAGFQLRRGKLFAPLAFPQPANQFSVPKLLSAKTYPSRLRGK